MGGRTGLPLPDLLRDDPKDRKHLNHDLYNDVRHSCGRPNIHIFFKTHKEVFQATKQVHQSMLASADILDGLGNVSSRTPTRRVKSNAYLEQDSNPGKNRTRKWRYLQQR